MFTTVGIHIYDLSNPLETEKTREADDKTQSVNVKQQAMRKHT
jgi:hypothetical protein